MNRDNIEALIKTLEQTRHRSTWISAADDAVNCFNMDNFFFNNYCGTPACIAGWGTFLAHEGKVPSAAQHTADSVASHWLDLDPSWAIDMLFYPSFIGKDGLPLYMLGSLQPKDAVHALKAVLAAGEDYIHLNDTFHLWGKDYAK